MTRRHVILVGMMGVGKSSLGRRLAKQMGVPFVDSDVETERAAGMGITALFEKYGADELRALERRVLQRLLHMPPQVIATGGDAFVDAETRIVLKEGGLTIWLQASLETIVSRIRRLEHRPLLQHGELRPTVARLLAEREALYAEAAVTLDTEKMPAADLLDAMARHAGA
jgi:shikimate kinase